MSAGKERVDLYDDRQIVEACVAALSGFERPQTASSLETQLRRDGIYTHRGRIADLLADAESLLMHALRTHPECEPHRRLLRELAGGAWLED